ncbi:Prostaglandin F synthase [Smittium culicis]|uniref:Prostaglandin F synthase n=1 Tax=Smittium culicis TaxID=133412 RepID=A0A1R1X8G6_9FUNG|nr:Prostaglandin F synthase [Smittium culicis]
MVFAQKITELRDGLKIPTVGFGTYKLKDKELTISTIKDAIRAGYRHIDTATVYTNEDAIGDALQEVFADDSYGVERRDIWITSKLAPVDQGYESTIEAVHKSLKKLKLDYIDMYLIHWPGTSSADPNDPDHKTLRIGSWRALEELKEKKLLRAIGVSNYQINHLEEMKEYAKIVPYVNQCEFHPLLYSKDLVEYTKSLGIVFESYSSLGKGHFTDGNTKYQELEDISSRTGASIAQVLLCWGIQHGTIVLPKSSSKARLIHNFECQKFTLSDEEMLAIDKISERKVERFAWDPTNIL